MVQTITIQDALALPSDSIIFVDTRSPKEFTLDHIPGAINIPIFSNEERADIGTIYKHNQDEAYKKGYAIYNEKVQGFIEKFKQIDANKKIIIYCWRGGMRSKTIAELVTGLGRETYQLIGGYKKFRAHVREELEKEIPFELIVLQGLAGCGKTDLIKKITPSIDLEGCAQHRSSLFGAIGLQPVSQKMFETKLWEQIQTCKNEKIVFIEGEAKKIGDLFVPERLFSKMQDAKTVEVVASIEGRSKRIVRDYFTHQEDEKIKDIIMQMKVYLSKKRCEELCALVDDQKYEDVAKALLVEHYDKQYTHALTQQEYIFKVNSDDIEKAVSELQQYITAAK